MPMYCPKCLGEFKDEIKICPKDNIDLTKKPSKDTFEKYKDIYKASSEIEKERIITLLKSSGIDCKFDNTSISQIPVLSDKMSIILVRQDMAKEAVSLIKQAREDGVLDLTGEFI